MSHHKNIKLNHECEAENQSCGSLFSITSLAGDRKGQIFLSNPRQIMDFLLVNYQVLHFHILKTR